MLYLKLVIFNSQLSQREALLELNSTSNLRIENLISSGKLTQGPRIYGKLYSANCAYVNQVD